MKICKLFLTSSLISIGPNKLNGFFSLISKIKKETTKFCGEILFKNNPYFDYIIMASDVPLNFNDHSEWLMQYPKALT